MMLRQIFFSNICFKSMEKLFFQLSRLSTLLVFLLLLATLISLYISAKPAIQAFGAHFIVDSRWGIEEDIPLSAQPALSDQKPLASADASETTTPASNNGSEGAPDNFASNDNPDGMDSMDGLDAMDEDIPMDDEMATGQADLVDNRHATTREIYGGAVPIVGTIFSTIIAMFFAVPLSLGIAVFLSEIASPRLAKPVGIAVELLAAIPSIIYGMWGLFYFGPFIAHIFGGNSVSLLVGGLVLGIMVIPFMAALSRDAINTTPPILKEAAYAMGATKTEVIKDIIFPYAKKGIIGSMIVSLGRAMGETMAVAFVIGGVYEFAGNITEPTNSIPVALANNFSESSGLSLSALFYLALLLFVISFFTIFSAKRLLFGKRKY